MEDEVSQLKTKQTILEQKKMRLNNNYSIHEKEIKEIQNNLKNLQTEMNKLNDKLALNKDSNLKLKNENINIRSEFAEKLKEMEKESVKLEVHIDKLREEKVKIYSLLQLFEEKIQPLQVFFIFLMIYFHKSG
jgi:coiled-coil domain-containing protein 40